MEDALFSFIFTYVSTFLMQESFDSSFEQNPQVFVKKQLALQFLRDNLSVVVALTRPFVPPTAAYLTDTLIVFPVYCNTL